MQPNPLKVDAEKLLFFLAVGSGIIGGVVGESGEEQGGNGGLAPSGLDYGRDLRVWICF